MCEFFSFIVSEANGVYYVHYFDSVQRVGLELCDSHTHISNHFLGTLLREDRCGKYEFIKGELKIDSSGGEDMDLWAAEWIAKFQHSKEFYDICLVEVAQDGYSLGSVPKNIKTYDMCVTAIKNCGLALKFVQEHHKTKQLCLAALQQYKCVLKHIPEHLTEAVLLAEKR